MIGPNFTICLKGLKKNCTIFPFLAHCIFFGGFKTARILEVKANLILFKSAVSNQGLFKLSKVRDFIHVIFCTCAVFFNCFFFFLHRAIQKIQLIDLDQQTLFYNVVYIGYNSYHMTHVVEYIHYTCHRLTYLQACSVVWNGLKSVQI